MTEATQASHMSKIPGLIFLQVAFIFHRQVQILYFRFRKAKRLASMRSDFVLRQSRLPRRNVRVNSTFAELNAWPWGWTE